MSEPRVPAAADAPYRVLARKYRPMTFAEVVGQDAMVRTLTNALRSGRLAHAFILTGVRGVGKTTTARLIARALNCRGPDGKGGPTVAPCGVCEPCVAIAESRSVDVLEMDAASRTGIGDVREIIDSVRYLPVSERYKIYIIDEVHMLSNAAFNGLLKTLEEPPEHVKFIFATTETRRVPVTVLSRCQRFDLRRIDTATLDRHLTDIALREGADIAPEAIALIVRAAEGSARDGLSLLDQAISHAGGPISEAHVRDMLGLADRMRVLELLDLVLSGKVADALAELRAQYDQGADPAIVLSDMLDLAHELTRFKLVPEAASDLSVPEAERVRAAAMAQALPLPALARLWQMLLKGLDETRRAPNPIAAAEMVLVRIAYAADLPSPAEIVVSFVGGGEGAARAAGASGAVSEAVPAAAQTVASPSSASDGAGERHAALKPRASAAPLPAAEEAVSPPADEMSDAPRDFEAIIALAAERREAVLAAHLVNDVHLVSFEPGRIELRPGPRAPARLANDLGARLGEWTGRRWVVSISQAEGRPSLAEERRARETAEKTRAAAAPAVRALLDAFPDAEILEVRYVGGLIADPDLEDEALLDPGTEGDAS